MVEYSKIFIREKAAPYEIIMGIVPQIDVKRRNAS